MSEPRGVRGGGSLESYSAGIVALRDVTLAMARRARRRRGALGLRQVDALAARRRDGRRRRRPRADRGERRTELSAALERGNVALVFQTHSLFPHLSAFDNMAYGLRLSRDAWKTPSSDASGRPRGRSASRHCSSGDRASSREGSVSGSPSAARSRPPGPDPPARRAALEPWMRTCAPIFDRRSFGSTGSSAG
jgi:hypothetical protein